jgi:hypothetical protein
MNLATRVTIQGDRIEIQTDPRRASAIMQVLGGATLQEVGDAMGITRERVRQYLKDAQLRASLVRTRLRPTSRTDQARFNKIGAFKRSLIARRKTRAAQWVPWLRDYAEREGRNPTLEVFARAVFGRRVPKNSCAGLLIRYFASKAGLGTHREIRRIHALYRMAALEIRGYTKDAQHSRAIGKKAKARWRHMTPTEKRRIVRAMQAGRNRQRRHRRKA